MVVPWETLVTTKAENKSIILHKHNFVWKVFTAQMCASGYPQSCWERPLKDSHS